MTDRPTASTINDQQLDELHDALDGAYRERAHLVAWLAALHPAVIAPAPDVDEDGWQILYLTSSAYGWQMTWHIHPRDAELFKDVEHVPADDPRAQWDGHSTEQKYNRMRMHVRVVHMNNRLGATSCPVCEGSGRCPACRTTMRAALDEPTPITDAAGRVVCTCTIDTRCGCGTSVHYQSATPDPAATQATEPACGNACAEGHTYGFRCEQQRGQVVTVEGSPAAAHEAIRQMDADPHGLAAGMIVKPYTDHGLQRWVFRCWGTDTCDGWLSLDHSSEQSAERARDRHVTEEH